MAYQIQIEITIIRYYHEYRRLNAIERMDIYTLIN